MKFDLPWGQPKVLVVDGGHLGDCWKQRNGTQNRGQNEQYRFGGHLYDG